MGSSMGSATQSIYELVVVSRTRNLWDNRTRCRFFFWRFPESVLKPHFDFD